MTVELDEERGPHVRVTQGTEPPAFLNIFSGGFTVHGSRRGGGGNSPQSDRRGSGAGDPVKMFLVRGEAVNEAHLTGVGVNRAHLRSRCSLLLVDLKACVVHLWHGCKALKHTRKVRLS